MILSILSFMLVVGISLDVSANAIEDKIDNIREEQKTVSGEKDDATQELNKLQKSEQSLKQQIEQLDVKIGETIDNVHSKEEDVKKTENEVKELKKEISVLEEKIQKRDEVIKNRLIALQENGGSISFMSVILGANSIGDFLMRMSAVNTLVKADQDIMGQQQSDQQELKETKVQVEKKLAQIEDSLQQLKILQST